jgi:UDP-N-acetylglucosamine 2-epimerase
VLDHYAPRIAESSVLDDLALTRGGFVLASVHREENVDDPRNLTRIIASLLALRDRFGVRMVVSAHPRLRDRLERHRDAVGDISGIEFYEPFGYFDYMALQTNALCVVSDSGTISEESAMLGFPAVTIRESMERPEALDTGSIAITGLDPSTVTELVDGVLRSRAAGHRPMVPEGYDISDCSLRVCNLITGLAGLHRQWAGLGEPRSNDGDTIGG